MFDRANLDLSSLPQQQMASVVLVVEDDPLVLEIIELNLPLDGWHVVSVADCETALESLIYSPPDVIVLDLMLPGKNGLEFCQELRNYPDEKISQIPILMLTALAMQEDKLNGFYVGADDYLVKPFDPRELDARLRVLLKRTRRDLENLAGVIRRGILVLYLDTRKAICSGTTLRLKPQEFDLLLALARQPEKVFSRDDLLKEVWGYSMVVPSRTIDTHVSRLRQKLKEAAPRAENFIQTVHGIGYKLEIP